MVQAESEKTAICSFILKMAFGAATKMAAYKPAEGTPEIKIHLKGVSPMVQEESQHQSVGLLGLDCLECKGNRIKQ